MCPSIPESHISLLFALRLTDFCLFVCLFVCFLQARREHNRWPHLQSPGDPNRATFVRGQQLNFLPKLVGNHLGKNAPNEAKWPWTLQGQRYPIEVLMVSLPLKCRSSTSCSQVKCHYEAEVAFWKLYLGENSKYREWLHDDIKALWIKVPHVHVYLQLRPKFCSVWFPRYL